MKTTLYALYRGNAIVWVEDPLTYSVLTELWRDPDLNVVVTQGKPGVLHMVRANPETDRLRVYGIVDRDFDDDDEPRWREPSHRVLRLPAHELENLLLDFDVLGVLAKGTGAPEIRALAHAHASASCWWMVHKAVLREMQRDLGAGFPREAPTGGTLRDAADVEHALRDSPYWREHRAALTLWGAQSTRLHDRIEAWGLRLQADLAGDGWTLSFSGKEIFRYLRSNVRGLDEAPKRPPNPTGADRDLDLGKRVARQMNEMARVPPKLTELRHVIRAKAGI